MNIYSYEYVAAATSTAKPGAGGDLKQTRRRLSVMSDNKLIEGIDHVNISEEPPVVCFIFISYIH